MAEIAGVLIKCGVKRTVALVAEVLSNGKEISMRDIEKATDLRQPEVSIAIKELLPYLDITRNSGSQARGRTPKVVKMKETGFVDFVNQVARDVEAQVAVVVNGLSGLEKLVERK